MIKIVRQRTGGVISTAILAPDGSMTAPSFSFSSDVDTGMFLNSAGDGRLRFTSGGTTVAEFWTASTLAKFNFVGPLGFTTSVSAANPDVILDRDLANALALKNSTNAQTFNHYGSEITAGSRYSRLAIKHATTSVTAAVGATVTATSLIPAKANVLGVNTVVTTALGTGTGTTGYTVGDGTDVDRWGAVVGTAAGTDTDQTDATADPTGWFTAANNVVLTATGGNFDGTGVIFVDVAYTMTEAA